MYLLDYNIHRVAFHGVASHIFGNGILPAFDVPVSVFFGQYYYACTQIFFLNGLAK
jgi:hypothetical protein